MAIVAANAVVVFQKGEMTMSSVEFRTEQKTTHLYAQSILVWEALIKQ